MTIELFSYIEQQGKALIWSTHCHYTTRSLLLLAARRRRRTKAKFESEVVREWTARRTDADAADSLFDGKGESGCRRFANRK